MNFHDVELLSAYLDGQLSPSEVTRLEARLALDADLRQAMADLRSTRGLLRALPRRRAPRNFTLRPSLRAVAPPAPRAFPVLRFASVLATLLLFGTVAVNGLLPLAASRLAAAPAPAYGMGGGGAPEAAGTPLPAETGQPLLAAAPSAPAEPTSAPPEAQSQVQKTAPQVQRASAPAGQPIPTIWQVLLAGLAILLGLVAWYLHAETNRRFRQNWIDKRER